VAIVLVNQYREAWVSTKSSLKRRDSTPSQSLQDRYFSTIQASSPTGESDRP
jgi:hypothetical protein